MKPLIPYFVQNGLLLNENTIVGGTEKFCLNISKAFNDFHFFPIYKKESYRQYFPRMIEEFYIHCKRLGRSRTFPVSGGKLGSTCNYCSKYASHQNHFPSETSIQVKIKWPGNGQCNGQEWVIPAKINVVTPPPVKEQDPLEGRVLIV